METTLINHPRLRVHLTTGAEGPRHDPYSYRELSVHAGRKKVVLHEGLGEWLSVNGKKVEPPKYLDKLDWQTREKVERVWRMDEFGNAVGYTVDQIERIARKLNSRCRECGGREFHSESGFPGETFECCSKCGHIQNTFFNRSAIE